MIPDIAAACIERLFDPSPAVTEAEEVEKATGARLVAAAILDLRLLREGLVKTNGDDG